MEAAIFKDRELLICEYNTAAEDTCGILPKFI